MTEKKWSYRNDGKERVGSHDGSGAKFGKLKQNNLKNRLFLFLYGLLRKLRLSNQIAVTIAL
jgi:hypothetical protein